MILLLGLVPLSLAADPGAAVRALADRGKPEAAARRAEALLRKSPTEEEREDLLDALAYASRLGLDANPDLVRAQLFLERFPGDPSEARIRELAARLTLEQLGPDAAEPALLALCRDYAGTPSAARAAALAEDASWRALQGGGADQARAHLARYPDGAHAEAARRLAAERGFTEAEGLATADAWQALLDVEPGHPRAAEAAARRDDALWAALQAGGDVAPAALWVFAAAHADSERGWEAAVRALEGGGALSLDGAPAGDEARVDRVLGAFTLDIGRAPPPGYTLRAEVLVSTAGRWTPWSEALGSWEAALGLPPGATGVDAVQTELRGGAVSWSTRASVCTVDGAPLPTRLQVTMARGDRAHTWTRDISLTAPCPGARRMVFLRAADDLEGPVAVQRWRAGAWTDEPVLARLDPALACTHVSMVGPEGVTASCGPVEVRLGWEGATWVRASDPTARSSARAPLDPVVAGALPPAGRAPAKGTAGVPADRSRGEAATRPDVATGFGVPAGPRPVAAAIPAALERPSEPVPLPTGATPVTAVRTGIRAEDRAALQARYTPLGRGTPADELRVDTRWRVGVLSGGPGGSTLLVADGPDGWYRVLPAPELRDPARASWVAFTLGDAVYLRTVVAGAMCGQTLTLRHGSAGPELDRGSAPC